MTHLIFDGLVSTVESSSEHWFLTWSWLGLCLQTNLEGGGKEGEKEEGGKGEKEEGGKGEKEMREKGRGRRGRTKEGSEKEGEGKKVGVVRTKQKQGGRREVKGSNTIYKLICFGVVTML